MSALAPGTFFSHDDMVGERFVHVTAFDATANSGNSGAAQTRRSPGKTDDESLPGGMGDGSVLGLGSDWGLMCSGVAAAIFLLLSAVVALAGRVRRLETLLGQTLEQDKPSASEPSSLCLTTAAPTSADDVQYMFKCGDGAGGRPSITGVSRPLSGVLRERVSVLDFGAKNDGTAASTLSCCFVDRLP